MKLSRFALSASFAAMIALGGVSAAQAAEMVVISSTSGAVTAGGMIDGDQTLNLGAGETVTLLSSSGQTINLAGPYNGKPATQSSGGGDSKAMAAISAMFQSQQQSTASLGAVRAASTEAAEVQVPDPWVVSVENSGDRCLKDGRAVLWRASASGAGQLQLEGTGALRKKIGGAWPAGKDRIALQPGFFSDGKSYRATLDGRTVEITTHILPSTLDLNNPVAVASAMAERNCTNQAMALLNTLQ